MESLAGQVAVVFGGSSGIGRATAYALAMAGAATVVAARRDDLMQDVAAQITASGGQALGLAVDAGRCDRSAGQPFRSVVS